MTTPKPPKKRFKVEPEPGSQLEQFLIEHKRAKDAAAAAVEQEAGYKAAIKSYLLSLFPDGTGLPDAFDIAADAHGRYPGYSMSLKGVGSFRFDTTALKDQSPETYVRYAVPVTPSWELRESVQGQGRKKQ